MSGGPSHGEAIVTTPHFYAWMKGQLTVNQLRELLLSEFTSDEIDGILTEACSPGRAWIEETVTLIPQLKKSGYNIYLLSNLAQEVYEVHKDHAIFTHFDSIICSHAVGLIKPDLSIYKLLLEKYKLLPHESVFIDDVLRNVEAAQQAGITGILYKPGSLKESLLALGMRSIASSFRPMVSTLRT